jgi:glycosyltransferase involved in cell wall biosynthesis
MSSRDVGVRDVCRLSPTDPLLVYIGSPAPQRGIMTIVESLAQLPGVHAAAVLPAGAKQAALLLERADELGVRDRFHLLPYVEPDSVVDFIRSADIGVIPIHHQVNHEISLITKYFDYVHAGLPIIVSDVETMGRTTRELGNGEVFTAGSTDDFATAVRAVLADRDTYAKVYTPALVREWSWEVQAERLVALYDSLVPRPARPEDVHA